MLRGDVPLVCVTAEILTRPNLTAEQCGDLLCAGPAGYSRSPATVNVGLQAMAIPAIEGPAAHVFPFQRSTKLWFTCAGAKLQ